MRIRLLIDKLKTVNWRDIPTKSPSGASIGIVSAACPEPELTKKFMNIWITNIIYDAINDGNWPTTLAKLNNIVSIIFAFWAIIIIDLAKPINMAAPIISFAPSVNADAISFGANFPTIPLTSPTAKNIPDITPAWRVSLIFSLESVYPLWAIAVIATGGAATAIQVQAALDGVKEISIFNRKDAF